MRFTTILLLVLVVPYLTGCSTVPSTHKVGAVNVAERTIPLYAEHETPKTPQDLMKMTKGQIRVGEMFEVLKRHQVRNEVDGYAEEPFWLYIASRDRPTVRGWALADPVQAKRVNE